MKQIIVFGATGTVGAYTALYLKEMGYDVIASGRRKSDNSFFAQHGIRYISVDVSVKDHFDRLPYDAVDAIVNLSGMLPARMKGYCPQTYIDINVTGSLNILEYAVKVKAGKVIFTQSISDVAYLCGNVVPIAADVESKFPLDNDHSVYSICKTAACNMLIHYAIHYGFKYFTLRFPNIYLYHPNPYYYVDGEKRMQAYRLMIRKAIKGEPLSVWGNPECVRDIVYVKDCCQIIEKCLSAENAESGMYNVGTGIGTSIEDQIKGIIKVFSPKDKPSPLTYDPQRPDSPEYIFDVSKTKEQLGYVPQYSYMDYLIDFKKEMEQQTFAQLWGKEVAW
jgi:UDP-glucose 4-epimerase